MERDRNKMADRIINLTLQILFRLTGEDYTVVKKSSSGRCRAPVCEGWGRTLSPIPGPPPHSLIHEEMNEQKILELINKMMELLTGEVPIRCQDVAVYFSMEEWEYVEGHKDQYKNQVMMEDQQPLTSPVRSSKRTAPERCPRPLLPQDHQGEDLNNINAPETDVSGDEQYKEDIPTGKDLIYINVTDIKEEETDVSCDEQYKEDIPTGKDLIYINATVIKKEKETDVSGDQQCKEDIPTGNDLNYINATDIKVEEETDVSGDEQYKEDIPTSNRPVLSADTSVHVRNCPDQERFPSKTSRKILVAGDQRRILYLQIIKQMMISHKIHMKNIPLSQIHPQPFTAKICHLILIYRSCLLSHHRKVTEGVLDIKELIQERNHIHAQNVGNVLLLNQVLFNIKELTQERSHFHVQYVGNVLFRNQTLLYIKELTQGRSHFHVQNVGNVLLGNQILFNIKELTQETSRFHV
ncbi:uncharacterized protein LOC130298160 isoform X2 [Hyla sarda]|uniref:uncharacterized protein LOC130298160 isoform X2 n=1 Tax=Hyla sarda TaxID=327740 RepID=UPI0024C309B5|nr:uncharacterized protein LOC130298160 isoform X2 [Hyla sarda]